MIISEKLKIAYLPMERTGSKGIEKIIRKLDPLTKIENDRYEIRNIPEGYNFVVSRRDPVKRLCSYYLRAIRLNYEEYQIDYSTFEEFLNFILKHKDEDFLLDTKSKLYAPLHKLINGKLKRFPLPLEYFESIGVTPDVIISHDTYEKDVRKTFTLNPTEVLEKVDVNDWDLTDHAFEGMEELANKYEGIK